MVVAVAVCQPLMSGACVCVCVARPHFGKSLDFSLIKLELPDFFFCFVFLILQTLRVRVEYRIPFPHSRDPLATPMRLAF